MANAKIGRLAAIHRYPLKSMMGETLNCVQVTRQGLLGDRSYALIDAETGKVASAKNPRRWPSLFDFRASYREPPRDSQPLPTVCITLPGGETHTSDEPDIDARLSAATGRPVRLARSATNATAEGYWPDHDWLGQRDQVFEFPLPTGTFFDGAAIHLLTTATLDRLRVLRPESRFEIPRFRPNFVIDTAAAGFVENAWIGRTIALGEVHLRIDGPCPRCIMTTLGQDSLPKDPAVLRTIVQNNEGNVGVYATVVRAGTVRRGDAVGVVENT